MTLSAQEERSLVGTWDVHVTVTDCHGNPVRTVRSIQTFDKSGSMTETANTASRGISLGVWSHQHEGDQIFPASYWFFRYTAIGTFASFAKVLDTITIGPDGRSSPQPGPFRTSMRIAIRSRSAASRMPQRAWQLRATETDSAASGPEPSAWARPARHIQAWQFMSLIRELHLVGSSKESA
jgi:hypothetical protein